jgi:RHS repeat-associated protein
VTTQTYDTFGRPLVNTVPKDTGVVITTPAPVYDENDNVTKSTAPNGAMSTAVYDNADQVSSATAPANNQTSPRTTSYTYDKTGNLKTTTEPKGTATTTDTTDYVTTNYYDEIYQLTSVINAKGDKVSYEYDNVGNVTKVIDPKKNATTDTTDYTAKTDYDLDHRVTVATDAAGKTSKRGYDKDSLVTSTTDAENNTTLITYDERGKQTEVKVPHEGTTTRSTKYEYDQVGNTTKVLSPRATAAGTTDAFTQRTAYDELNRPVKQYQPYDPADSRYNNPNVYTETTYDKVGRVAKSSLPPSDGETVRNDTTYSYYDNGWAKSSTDPWDIATTYDYDELGKQTTRTLTSAGGSSDRTMSWSYYPDGSLKSRSDDGVPVGKSVVLVDNSDTQNTSKTGTWTKGDITGQQGYNHETHASGTGTDAFTWTLNVPKDGTYAAYVKLPKVTGAATTAKYTLTHATGTVDKTIDQNATANQGTWVSLGSYSFKQGNDAKLQLFQNSGGVVVADGVKLVRDTSGDPADTEKSDFAYSYDINGNLTQIDDTSSTAKIDAYAITYTGLNQVQKVTESLSGTEKKSTSYTYDANGHPDTVTHPDQFSKYTYDLRELVKTVSVGASATDASPKVTSYTYTDRGQKLQETKANGNTVNYTYYLDRPVKSTSEKKPNGTLVDSHTYAYDPNGNKSQDVAKKMNADNHTAYLDSTTDYTYDPADRLAKSVKTGNGASTETYVHDDNSNVVNQTVQGTTTTYAYDRNRLLSASAGGQASSYNYDPFGRQESVTAGGKVIERSVYDGFDHVVESQKMDDTGVMKSTTYTFDPLDRTASKTAGGKTTDYDYLGMSNEVLGEEVSGQLTKSYQYSPWGERLSQVKHNSDGTSEDGYYGYNSHTDVETLTDDNGDTKATYGYTAYGNDDKSEFTGIDKPDAADPTKESYNPYRFNAKRWDAQSGTYDMGFRSYSPGLNRFTTRDMYNGALADMNLGADPYTSNRYAFCGGNPISSVELDGHMLAPADGGGGGDTRSGDGKPPADDTYNNWFWGQIRDIASELASQNDSAIVKRIFGNVLGWNTTPRGSGESEYDLLNPDYSKGLLTRPSYEAEYAQGDTWPVNPDNCSKGNSAAYYMPLDGLGRASGMHACLTQGDFGSVDGKGNYKGNTSSWIFGSPTPFPPSSDLTPRGFGKNMQRGHLLANILGGTGLDKRNLMPLYSRVNSPDMSTVEGDIANRIEKGETMYYSVSPNYSGGNLVPDSVTISWKSITNGDTNADMYANQVTLPNVYR